MENLNIKCFAYAPPAVISENLNFLLKETVVSCVFGNDLVPRLSFGTVKDLCDKIFILYRGKFSKKEELDQAIRNINNEKLNVPGNVIQIYRRGVHHEAEHFLGNYNNEFVAAGFVDTSFYHNIIFSSTMAEDHFATNYQESLKMLASSFEF